MTLVSFVIPNYNHARYVGDAIGSALAQSHPDIEVIVVDDGSTDESRTIVQRFGKRVNLVCQENRGLSAARNTGIQAATGEYIALLDADDMVEPAYVERLLAAVAVSSEVDGAYCGFRYVDQENRPQPRVERRVLDPSALHGALLNGNFWVPESLLIRRDCYLAIGEFDTSLRSCEDWDIWLRFSHRYQLVGIEDILVRYRVVLGSMSSNPGRMLEHRLRVLHKHAGQQPDHGGTSAAHEAYARAYLRGAIEYFQGSDDQAGYACLVTALRLFPLLAHERATYYELVSSSQQKGSEGHLEQHQVARQQGALLDLIARLSREPLLCAQGAASTRAWQAQALWALAQLYYQAGDSTSARTAWRQASDLDRNLLRSRTFLSLGARTVPGGQYLSRLKRLAGRQATPVK